MQNQLFVLLMHCIKIHFVQQMPLPDLDGGDCDFNLDGLVDSIIDEICNPESEDNTFNKDINRINVQIRNVESMLILFLCTMFFFNLLL